MEWSSEEKQMLIEYYPKYSLRELEVIFKRNGSAISEKARSLGARKYEKKTPAEYDVSLKIMTITCRVKANNKTDAKHKAIKKVDKKIRRLSTIKGLVLLAKSTVKRIKIYGKPH